LTDDPDVAALRQRYPGWEISAHWITSATLPDLRIILARCGGTRLAALTAADLARQIEDHTGQ
jgi:hypothetical protein